MARRSARRRDPPGVAGRIAPEPELIPLVNLGVGGERGQEGEPGHRGRPEAVNQDDRDLFGIVGGGQEEARQLAFAVFPLHRAEEGFGIRQTGGLHLFEIRIDVVVRNGGRQVGGQGQARPADGDGRLNERVEELQTHLRLGGGALVGKPASAAGRTEQKGHREREIGREEVLFGTAAAAARDDDRNAEPLAGVVRRKTLDLVVGDEPDPADLVLPPRGAPQAAGDPPVAAVDRGGPVVPRRGGLPAVLAAVFEQPAQKAFHRHIAVGEGLPILLGNGVPLRLEDRVEKVAPAVENDRDVEFAGVAGIGLFEARRLVVAELAEGRQEI